MSAPKAIHDYPLRKDYVDRLAVGDAQIKAGLMCCYTFNIADGASADYDITIKDKIEVVDVLVQKRGGAGGAAGTVIVKNAANAISDAIDINDADVLLSRAASIDDAYSTIESGGTLRVSMVDSANSAVFVTVLCIVRA